MSNNKIEERQGLISDDKNRRETYTSSERERERERERCIHIYKRTKTRKKKPRFVIEREIASSGGFSGCLFAPLDRKRKAFPLEDVAKINTP